MKGYKPYAACADTAAFERSKNIPPSLPLPPGITFAQLPALLKPVPRKGGGWRKPTPAGAAKENGGVNGNSGVLAEADVARTQIPKAKEKDNDEAKPPLGLHGAIMCFEETGYLWENKSDDELAIHLEHCLTDFDSLSRECDALFEMCHDGDKVSPTDLRRVTQALIDHLGCREALALHKIHMIYKLLQSTAAESGLGPVVFRGYVAAVLTQIQQELVRRQKNDGSEEFTDEDWRCVSVESVLTDMGHTVKQEDEDLGDAISNWLQQVANALTFGSWQENQPPPSDEEEVILDAPAQPIILPLQSDSMAGWEVAPQHQAEGASGEKESAGK